MRLKNDFSEDQLDREKTAIDYVNFINTLQGNHTIALDAPWGSGKIKIYISHITHGKMTTLKTHFYH